MSYPGLTYIGSGKISGLYGLNETIHDQKSIGLQHLYVDTYENDLIYMATSVLKAYDTCYYGDRIKQITGHPIKQKSKKSYTERGFVFVDTFCYTDFEKTDKVACVSDYTLAFSSEVKNLSNQEKEITLGSMVVTTDGDITLRKEKNSIIIEHKKKKIQYSCTEENVIYHLSIESPSGFMYHGVQDILYDENIWEDGTRDILGSAVLTVGKKVILQPKETYTFQWRLDFSKDETIDYTHIKEQNSWLDGSTYWKNWLSSSEYELNEDMLTNLIALKAVNMNGFIPADLTGHYFASNDIAFYVRDALHGAKAFLFSGFYEECKQVIHLVMKLKRKKNHELFQRYNSRLIPDEGANNNVFSQIDVIGYLLSIVVDYEELTKELLVDIEKLFEEVKILEKIEKKNGLYGPEGGVNEGVYGPAFITSTNIFIAAGLYRLLDIMKRHHYEEDNMYAYVNDIFSQLKVAINNTFLKENYFGYGYVSYHNQIIKRYDTPQLFGAGLGYPIDINYRKNFECLTNIATYFGYGYGYSEQQYHDGPWLFNTCYAAQNAYIMENIELYEKIMIWIENHKNAYGLLPEAIDARNEKHSFINPLMWANAEYICAKQVSVIQKLRKGEKHDYTQN